MPRLQKAEPILFTVIFLIHLIPVFILTPFVTLDGPVHLCNARIIHDLWTHADPITTRFFEFNPVIEPNLTGHYLMAALLFLFKPVITEKIIIVFILSTFAFGYRKLILTMEPGGGIITWLLFPLMYNFTFLIGFFNFMIGLSLLPYFLILWISFHQRTGLSPISIVKLMLLLVLIYYSHIMIFMLAMLLAFLIAVFSKDATSLMRSIGKLIIIGTPGALLAFCYFLTHDSRGFHQEIQYLPFAKIIQDIANSSWMIMYDYSTEKRFTKFYSMLLILIFIPALKYHTIHKYRVTGIAIFLTAIVLLFAIPDSFASGGIITPRFELWLAISFVLLLSTFRIPTVYSGTSGILAVILSCFMMIYHFRTQSILTQSANTILQASNNLEEPSVLLPVNYSRNWLDANLPSYIGASRQIVVLDNYEADYRLFPIVWREHYKPAEHAGNHAATNRPCLTILKSENITGCKINYISFWQGTPDNADTCSIGVQQQLKELYSDPALVTGDFTIYRRK